MYNPKSTKGGTLPLYNEGGLPDARGFIACQTCHIMHGHLPDAEAPQTDVEKEFERISGLSAEQRSAMRLMLRPFAEDNICLDCHGQDGLRRFLYFHDPIRRKGAGREAAAFRKTARQ